MLATLLAQSDGSFWMPPRAASGAEGVDWLFYLILGISAFFFFLIVAVMVFFVIRYRRREGHPAQNTPSHSTALELTWSLIPAALLLLMFYLGFKAFMDMYTPPGDAMQVNVIGRRWTWAFEYPDTGYIHDNDLHVPVNKSVKLVLTSEDVIHSLFIPAFRLKRDAVPGRYNKAWFKPTQVGEFDLLCAEYCGTSHSDMLGKVVVHAPGEFEVWMKEEMKNPLMELTQEQLDDYLRDPPDFLARHPELGLTPPADLGAKLYKVKGCAQCHTVDGTAATGPSLKGLFGTKRQFQDGSSEVADENYLRKSMVDPQSQVVAGYDGIMPTYKSRLNDREIGMLIEYIRSLDEE